MNVCPDCNGEYLDEDNHICPDKAALLARLNQDPMVGQVISDRYEIVAVQGRGGMGVVYKARQLYMDRLVAIKMLHSHLVTDAEALRRFKNEAQAVSRVRHPHTVTLYDFGISNTGQPYLVMDFIEGQSLRHLMKQSGPLPFPRVLHIFLQVVDALSFAHQAGVIHRDLKPENIMLTDKGTQTDWVEVVDFGISQLQMPDNPGVLQQQPQHDRKVRGSPPYMSPEQCLMMPVIDHRSDIYALGVVLFESLSGRLPFSARNTFEMLDCHVSVAPMLLKAAHPTLQSCESLTAMVARALDKRPERRQQSVEEFAAELAEAIKKDTVRMRSLKNRLDELNVKAEETAPESPAPNVVANADGEEIAEIPETLFAKVADQGITDTLVETFSKIVALAKPSDGLDDRLSPSGQISSPLSTERKRRGFIDSIAQAVFNKDEDQPEFHEQAKYVVSHCPHCGDQVEKDIAFCLSCGRSLVNSQEFSKIRAVSGVFSLPKAHDTSAAPTAAPAFTHMRSARTEAAARFNNPSLIIMVVGGIIVIGLVFLLGNVIGRFFVPEPERATQHEPTERAQPLPQAQNSGGESKGPDEAQ